MATVKSLLWLKERSSGILLHPTSLPAPHGIGVIGSEAGDFIDFLKEAGVRYWQTLPLGPTGYGDSPYQSFSAFAGNPYLIDFRPLQEFRLLGGEDTGALMQLPADHVDFGALYRIKWPLLRLAFKRFTEQKRTYLPNYGLYEAFKHEQADWLEPFSAFMALKERFNGAFWGEWPEACQTLDSARSSRFWKETGEAREAHAFYQYVFAGQWSLLRDRAQAAGIELIGDVPIFVSLDSADVWAEPGLFEMQTPGKPDFVAGVPPDYFSETGQLWGNPLFNWQVMKEDDFTWWRRRLEANFRLFDVVRLDHFRGFYDYWRIPAGAGDARAGAWAKGPRTAFFKAIAKHLDSPRFIAEDLGEIDETVRDFRDRVHLPGMAILQFAFGSGPDNLYLPHNLTEHSVVYPGSHDNNTTRGWYEAAGEGIRDHARRYLRVSGNDIAWDFIRCLYQSTSKLVILPMQDILDLPGSARMNVPGTEQGNWQWRMSGERFSERRSCAPYLRELGHLYGR